MNKVFKYWALSCRIILSLPSMQSHHSRHKQASSVTFRPHKRRQLQIVILQWTSQACQSTRSINNKSSTCSMASPQPNQLNKLHSQLVRFSHPPYPSSNLRSTDHQSIKLWPLMVMVLKMELEQSYCSSNSSSNWWSSSELQVSRTLPSSS